MPDYIYLLENRLSADQQSALRHMREAAREAATILFLTGDAVRDLTSGHAVRNLEVSVHGNALNLKKTIERLGGSIWGEDETARALYLCFPGTVRVDLVSTHRIEYPKPGKPVYHPASIQEDLRCRDFTVNAMAISLNEGSFGLLMDPLNGAADIESRTLRLVSNYGFLEEPSLLIRATRYMARLGWELDPKTRTRYDNARGEGVIEHLSAKARSRELEQIGHEEDGLKVLSALEAEGWMNVLFPAWTAAKADEEGLKTLHSLAVQLLLEGVHPDMSAAQMRLLTANLAPKDLATLKKLMLRPGFVEEWNSLDALAAGFARVLLAKENSTPSISFKLFTSYDPEAILWLGFTSKDAAVKERFNLFLTGWPEARQRIPHALMQEMRITPELPNYSEIVQSVFLQLIDGKLATPEEARAFLEPFSPPAPPPQVTIKRPRAKRGAEARVKEASYDDEESEDGAEEDDDLDDIGGDDDLDLGIPVPKGDLDLDVADEADAEADEEEGDDEEPKTASVKRGAKAPAPSKLPLTGVHGPAKTAKPSAPKAIQAEKAEKIPASPKPKGETKSHSASPVKHAAATVAKPVAAVAKPKPAPARTAAVPAHKPASQGKTAVKTVSAKTYGKPAVKPSAKTPSKPAAKAAPKQTAKAVSKHSPAKHSPAKAAPAKKKPVAVPSHKPVKPSKPAPKPAAKKPVHKAAKKR
jgi:tRNA nucleotidyltransferase/poly(A) polymerase